MPKVNLLDCSIAEHHRQEPAFSLGCNRWTLVTGHAATHSPSLWYNGLNPRNL